MFGLLLHQSPVRLPSCVPAGAGKVTFIMYYMASEISYSAVHLHSATCTSRVERREEKESLR